MSLGSYCSLKANFSVVSNISGPPETESSRLLNLSFRAKTTSQFQQSYQLLDELGRGGYGFVYRCVSRFTRRVCAVKFNIDPNSVNCMKREYNIISEICQKTGHPNIVNVLDSICDDRIMYNIFELATGGDLYLDLDEKGYYSAPVAADVMMQTLYGVDYIHSRGYLHRDIKTPNLLVLKRNYLHVKITDFGLAVRRKKNDQSNTPPFVPHLHGYAGTDCYICPEALQNSKYDTECDVWSCAVVLYEMLTGNTAFDGAPLDNELTFPYPEWRGLDDAKDLCIKMFDRTTPNRYTIAEALNHPFITKHTGHRQIRQNLDSAMAHYIGMEKLKLEMFKLSPSTIL